MSIKFFPLYLLTLFFSTAVFSQLTQSEEDLIAPSRSISPEIDYSIEFHLKGLGSVGERLPFWLYHNQRGRVSHDSNISGWISGKHVQFFSRNSYLIIGGGLLYDEGNSKGILIDELYGHYQNSWMYATAGRKQKPELYNGISSSNESILWSLNARPLPGIQIGTTRPLFPFSEEGFGFEGSWNEYLMGNERDTQGARLHHKNLRFVYRSGDWQLKAGMHHFVQWAGTAPRYGKQPGTFQDYLRVISGQAGGASATEGDQQNALGNTVGGYEFYISKDFRDFSLEAFYNHLFEDGSGRRLGNTPDGRYGIFYEHRNKNQFIHSVMYELYYTNHQSHTTSGIHKYDDYFNNGIYRSGWSYKGRILGAPFFTPRPSGLGVINNKFTAHHLGIGGQFNNYINTFPFRLMLSYSHNDGRYAQRFRPKQDVFYGFFDIRLLKKVVELNLQLGLEYNSYASPIYGAGVHLVYKL